MWEYLKDVAHVYINPVSGAQRLMIQPKHMFQSVKPAVILLPLRNSQTKDRFFHQACGVPTYLSHKACPLITLIPRLSSHQPQNIQ